MEQATKAQRAVDGGGRSIHAPAALTPLNDPICIVQEEGVQARSGRVHKISPPYRDSIPGF